ncbi:uncharacterized protein LOC127255839 [Andrographis paniculata]|uniref:uncharacterized protein LOC127255839 n=1 Tax=Andrographis paniculata TaxID=175694 RepID=UPI0021E86C3F|nr:uncharacterized protein LOC127255839 [Andrographis paniculata]
MMIRKTSFPMKRWSSSSSMEAPSKISHQFPTSPVEEITHYTHSQHPLTKISSPELFVCAGCKEYGAGYRFACQQCEFQLHEFCAAPRPLLKNHPLHGQHQLVFHVKPKQAKAGMAWPKCNVCAKSIKGFTYRCKACSFQMHPCCAMLSTEILFAVHPHPLKLLPAISTSPVAINGGSAATATATACGECNKRRSGRMYRCTVCDYHLHATCAKSQINGLQANGIPTPEKPSPLGTAARLASQVVIEFIGGLIEGFGEGVGEAIVQNITRGRCMSRRRIQE